MTGLKKYPLISENISLDLVNTEIVRRGKRLDLLCTEVDLLDWLKMMEESKHSFSNQLLLKVESMEGILFSIRQLRQVLRGEFERIADGQVVSNEFIKFLEKKIIQAPFIYKLINQSLIQIPTGKVEDALSSLIAYDILNLIGRNRLRFIKRCANEHCVLLFIDESGRRKWCSMDICGNRQKVANFQRKKADEG